MSVQWLTWFQSHGTRTACLLWLLAGCAPSRQDAGGNHTPGVNGHAAASSSYPYATAHAHAEEDSLDGVLMEFDCDIAYDFSAWGGTDRAKDAAVRQLVLATIEDLAPAFDADALEEGIDPQLLDGARKHATEDSSVTQKVELIGIACNIDPKTE